MRQRLIDLLNAYFGVEFFHNLIPDMATIMVVGILAMSVLFVVRCKKSALSWKHATGMIILASFTGLVGGHLFFLLQNLRYVFHHPALIADITGDSVSFGVYTGAVAGAYIYSLIFPLPLLRYVDTGVSVLGLGIMFGRLGCYLHGCDFGKTSDMAWAVRFPNGSYPFVHQVQKGWIHATDALSLPVHPVQLYGCIKGLALFVVFSVLWKRNYFKPGVLFLLFWIAFSVCRCMLEFFRDDDRGSVLGVSTGQYCCLLMFSISVAFLWIGYGREIRIRTDGVSKVNVS